MKNYSKIKCQTLVVVVVITIVVVKTIKRKSSESVDDNYAWCMD